MRANRSALLPVRGLALANWRCSKRIVGYSTPNPVEFVVDVVLLALGDSRICGTSLCRRVFYDSLLR